MGEEKELIPIRKEKAEQPIAGIHIELDDTPENQKRIGELAEKLQTAITLGKANIGVAIGLRGGKVILEAENMDLVPPRRRKKKKLSIAA